jgi:hypothetical protein
MGLGQFSWMTYDILLTLSLLQWIREAMEMSTSVKSSHESDHTNENRTHPSIYFLELCLVF